MHTKSDLPACSRAGSMSEE